MNVEVLGKKSVNELIQVLTLERELESIEIEVKNKLKKKRGELLELLEKKELELLEKNMEGI
jgi:hypothetical protein